MTRLNSEVRALVGAQFNPLVSDSGSRPVRGIQCELSKAWLLIDPPSGKANANALEASDGYEP